MSLSVARKTGSQALLGGLLLFLMLLFCTALSQKVEFAKSDLGRHLTNGRILFETGSILRTNTYSYTAPGHSVPCHHWGAGALFYALSQIGGFEALSLLNLIVLLSALGLLLRPAWKEAGAPAALTALCLALPFLAHRTEPRPEMFSALFFTAYFCLSRRWRQQERPRVFDWIAVLAVQILWVNLHIFFFLGPFLLLVFMLERFLRQPSAPRVPWLLLFAAACAVNFLNPFFAQGALSPFFIFRNYGYNPPENLPVWELQRFLPSPLYGYAAATAILSLALALKIYSEKRDAQTLWEAALLLFFFVWGFCMVRILPLAGWTFLAFLPGWVKRSGYAWPAGLPFFATLILLFFHPGLRFLGPDSGWGIKEGVQDSAQFFKQQALKGPLFNNYGIGGYLIYHFYPHEPVFVDNRPEAYPPGFFKELYFRMLEDEGFWKERSESLGIRHIYFHLGMHLQLASPIAFLERRLRDPEWKVIFQDRFAIILSRQPAGNA